MTRQFTSPKISIQVGKCESVPDHSSCSQNIEEMTSHHCRIGLENAAPFPGTRLHKDKHRDLRILVAACSRQVTSNVLKDVVILKNKKEEEICILGFSE